MTTRFAPLPWLAALAALVLSSVLTLAWLARDLGAQRVIHTLNGNTTAIGTALRIQFERAVAVGMPIEELVGVEPLFAEHLRRHREVSFFALLDARQTPRVFSASPTLSAPDAARARQHAHAAAGAGASVGVGGDVGSGGGGLAASGFRTVRTPIQAADGSGTAGWLLTGYPVNYIDSQVNAVVTDLLVAVLIAIILTLEMVRFAGSWRRWRLLFQFGTFVRSVQHGQLSVRSPLTAADRWSQLGQDMNRRIEQLALKLTGLLAAAPPAHGTDHAWHQRLRQWGAQHGLLASPRPWQGSQSVSQLRMLVFLVALSDELVRPFMAVHASQLNGPLALSPEALAGIPLTTFLLTWALSQPFGAALLRRHGSRLCLMGATAAVGVPMLATALTTDWLALTLLRGLTGAGFGFVLICAQTLMLRLGRATGRAAAMAEFVGAVVAAGICGPVIGGLMTVKLGTPATLVASGMCALAALALAAGQAAIAPPESASQPMSWGNLAALVRHRHLRTLLLCSAIPGKLAATAVLLLVVPLAVADMGESASLTGRLLLLYFLAFWLVARWAGRLSDRHRARKPFVVAGGLVSALGCGMGLAVDGVWGLVGLSFLLGLGQAWLSSPQIVWATQMADQGHGTTDGELILGIYRLVERFGGALGPLLVAGLVSTQGLKASLAVLAAALVLGSGMTWLGLAEAAPGTRADTPGSQP